MAGFKGGVGEKAKWLIESGMVTVDLLYLTIKGKEENHGVSFRNGKYICDCKWATLQSTDCSHIKVAKILVEGRYVVQDAQKVVGVGAGTAQNACPGTPDGEGPL